MSNTEEGFHIKRILVPMDESRHSGSALKTAIHWAGQWQAELLGLFVEDVNLLNLASLPFSREISPLSPSARQLDRLRMEQTLRARAERCRKLLQEQAEQAKLSWSFQVSRGHVAAEVLSHGQDIDLVIMGRSGHSPAGAGRLGSAALSICRQSACSVFLTANGMEPVRPVVLFDGSAAAERGLMLAARLARVERCPLTVLLLAADGVRANTLRQQAGDRLSDSQIEWRLVLQPDALTAFKWVAESPGGAMLILNAASELWSEPACNTFLEQAPYPVLLVR